MTAYSITPADIAKILTSVETPVTALTTHFTGLSHAASDVNANDGMTDTVSKALKTLFDDQQARITNMSNRIQAAMQGVYFATLEYKNGEESMVATVQRAAVAAAQNGDFSYFAAEARKYDVGQGGGS